MSNRIHVLINGEQFGPYPEAEFRQHVAERKILKSDLVWREGLPEWITAGELAEKLIADLSRATVFPPTVRSRFDEAKAAAENGDVEQQFQLALIDEKGEGTALNYVEAARCFRRAAEQGHARAQLQLSLALAKGQGVVASPEESLQWLQRAAEAGQAEAQYTMGFKFANGQGLSQSDVEAVTWFRKGADLGNATAQFNLGRMYENGRGVRRDYAEANKWYAKSADQGIPEAQFNRGIMYYVGRGVRKDVTEAHKWFRVAASTFPESEPDKRLGAVRNRDLVASQMTPEQIAEAVIFAKPTARH